MTSEAVAVYAERSGKQVGSMITMTKNILRRECREAKDTDAGIPEALRRIARSLHNALKRQYRSKIALIPKDDLDRVRKTYKSKPAAVVAYCKDADARTGRYTAKQI